MDIIKFQTLLNEIERTELKKNKNDLFKSAINYQRYRIDWYSATEDERLSMDGSRRIAHNAFIDCCNILSRNMIKNGENANWRKELGDERKTLGDFACYIVFMIGVKVR